MEEMQFQRHAASQTIQTVCVRLFWGRCFFCVVGFFFLGGGELLYFLFVGFCFFQLFPPFPTFVIPQNMFSTTSVNDLQAFRSFAITSLPPPPHTHTTPPDPLTEVSCEHLIW